MAGTSHIKAREAFLEAYDEYADSIFRFCLLKTSDREVAHDLMQETFMRTWEYRMRGEEIKAWKAFLFRTANNLIIDWYRKKKSTSLNQMEEEVGYVVPDNANLDSADLAEVERALAFLDTLDEQYRDPVYLRLVEGLTPAEIADTMGVSENVVSVRVHRGIHKLRELLHTQ